ncbi:MAG: tRNA 2-thiocytidine(32) synthetase TtcA [Bacilli bacterium]|nr:tRNA 2-thiocytidine(32) synthetase TtcA [Bacilli bacterium]
MKAIRIILAGVRNADKTYHLFKKGDKIVVGISGGKDSLVLFYALTLYQKFAHTDFKIYPVMLDLGFPNFNPTKLKTWFKKLGYPLIINDASNVYPILKANQKQKKHLPCSICSRMKKAIINAVAKDLKCNKVAFAHHMDDAVETLFMNIFYAGKIATFEPKMHLSNANINFIRPLIFSREIDIARCAKEEKLPVLKSNCPADKQTNRYEIKKWLTTISKDNPLVMKNVYTSLKNEKQIKLWKQDNA